MIRQGDLPYIDGERGLALVRAFLRIKANPNGQAESEYKPLHLAVKAGFEEMIKRLIALGADVDAIDKSGLTPFQIAVMQENKALADLFLSKGAKQQSPPGIGYEKYYKLYPKQEIL